MTTTTPTPQPRSPEPDEDGFVEVTPEQWQAWVERTLAELGLTYEELAAQAEDNAFRSYAAASLWFHIG